MSLLDKLKRQAGVAAQAAGNVAQSAVQQTKSLASVGRVKLAIASEEDKMKKAYTELGRLFYRDYEAQTGITMEDYQPWCDKVADAKNQIARLNEELEKIRAEAPDDEIPAEEPAVVVDVSGQSEEQVNGAAEPEEMPEQPEVEAPEEPTVGTLYVDVTNTEE